MRARFCNARYITCSRTWRRWLRTEVYLCGQVEFRVLLQSFCILVSAWRNCFVVNLFFFNISIFQKKLLLHFGTYPFYHYAISPPFHHFVISSFRSSFRHFAISCFRHAQKPKVEIHALVTKIGNRIL